MRIGIVVHLYNIRAFDASAPNPGIGGTQYMSLALAALFAEHYDVTVFTDVPLQMAGVAVRPIEDIGQLTAEDVLIFSVANYDDQIRACPARLIAWAHNSKDRKFDELAARAEQIILLSAPQYDMLRWHVGIKKMRCIPYPFSPDMFTYRAQAEDHIVYLGALVPAKGFHHYAEALPQVLEGRQTKVYVIGATQTYGHAGEGRLGVSSKDYEDVFLPPIERFVDRGQVVFCGNMGVERFDLISRAKLGLTNPTGASETFCISNFELMSLGVPVMGGFYKGMLETLYRDRRLLLDSPREIAPKLNALLDAPDELARLRPQVRAFVEEKARVGEVFDMWKAVIERVPAKSVRLSSPMFRDHKVASYLLSKTGLRLTFDHLYAVERMVRAVKRQG